MIAHDRMEPVFVEIRFSFFSSDDDKGAHVEKDCFWFEWLYVYNMDLGFF